MHAVIWYSDSTGKAENGNQGMVAVRAVATDSACE